MIEETITFKFADAEQQRRFHERLNGTKLEKRPVAFRVWDHNQWVLINREEDARVMADLCGVDYQGLYVRDGK